MDGRPTWTDCDEAGDYVVPNVLSPRDLVFRPDKMDETVPHNFEKAGSLLFLARIFVCSCARACVHYKKYTPMVAITGHTTLIGKKEKWTNKGTDK